MFSSKEYLDKRTGPHGVGRFSYLQSLVTEFQDVDSEEAKEQVLANLANFAYDPINYDYLRQLNVIDLFLDCLQETNDKIMEYAMGGICNLCLDMDPCAGLHILAHGSIPLPYLPNLCAVLRPAPLASYYFPFLSFPLLSPCIGLSLDIENKDYILKNNGVTLTIGCLSCSNIETVLSAITTLMYLVTPTSKPDITTMPVIDCMLRFSKSSNQRLANLSNVFLQDYCHEAQVQAVLQASCNKGLLS